MADEEIRAFFAADLDDAARRAAAGVARGLREASGGDAVRWVRPEALHVTLRFLGNIDPARVRPLAHAVSDRVASLAPFEMRLGAARLFPSARRPRVVMVELAPAEPLEELAAAVEDGVVAAGFEPEGRRFRAHLTLGRLRGRRPPAMRGLAAPAGTACEVAEVVLYRSELKPSGAEYTPLERVALRGGGEASIEDHP
jgi:2'-5' RNA ligase